MKIGFIGCHEISWYCLKKICELSKKYGDTIAIVFNLDQEEAKKHSAYVDFDSLKEKFDFPLFYISRIDEKEIQMIKKLDLDVLFIIGWHRIVSQKVLDQSKTNLGIHSSLLPKNRGPSPLNWQIIRGEKQGGVTLFYLADDVDSGSIVDQENFEISFTDTIKTAYDKAIIASISLLEKNWNNIHSQKLNSFPQNENEITINDRRRPEDGLMNWNQDSTVCYNFIRALTNPYPGAFTIWKGKKIYIWDSQLSRNKQRKAGEIIESDDKIIISTSNGCLSLLSLQVENELKCSPEIFVKVYDLKKGDFFGK